MFVAARIGLIDLIASGYRFYSYGDASLLFRCEDDLP